MASYTDDDTMGLFRPIGSGPAVNFWPAGVGPFTAPPAPVFRPAGAPSPGPADGVFNQPPDQWTPPATGSWSPPAAPTASPFGRVATGVPTPSAPLSPPTRDFDAERRGGLTAGILGLLAGGLLGGARGALAVGSGAIGGYGQGAEQTYNSQFENVNAANQQGQIDYEHRRHAYQQLLEALRAR